MTRTKTTQLRATFRAVSALTAFAFAHTAHAQSAEDASSSRALFNEGRKLLAAGQFAEACPKFEESNRLKPGIGVAFNLADCWSKLGRSASAWSKFLEVASAASDAGQKDREAVARQRAATLEAELARLTVSVEEESSVTQILRDNVEFPRENWGKNLPVDPGEHRVEARRRGGAAPHTVTVAIEPRTSVRIAIPKLERPSRPRHRDASDQHEDPTATEAKLSDTPSNAERSSGGSLGTRRSIALGLGGLSLVGFVSGGYFLVQRAAHNEQAESLCPGSICDREDEIGRHDGFVIEARRDATLATVSFVAGGAALVAGTVLFLTGAPAEGSGATASQPGLSVCFSPESPGALAGASVRGQF